MYEAISNLGNMALGLILLVLNYSFEGTVFISIGAIMLIITLPLVLLIIVSLKPRTAKIAVNSILRGISRLDRNQWKLDRFQVEIDKLLDDYHEGITILIQNPKMILQPLIFSLFAWGLEVITIFWFSPRWDLWFLRIK